MTRPSECFNTIFTVFLQYHPMHEKMSFLLAQLLVNTLNATSKSFRMLKVLPKDKRLAKNFRL